MTPSGQTICLCMIVKNEAPVIRRCLESVRPLIHHWLIVDTGSIDGTQDIVRDLYRDIPGDLVERPWRDFAHNRSEALALARPHGDYSLIIDADDVMAVPEGFRLPVLRADSYVVDIRDGGIAYRRSQLVANALPWRYLGVLHEYLACETASSTGHLPLVMLRNHDGARRRDPETYRRDAMLLEQALQTETDPFLVSRYTFYLAQSYRDCGRREMAVDLYLRRADLGYWDQEIFYALYQAAQLMEGLGAPHDEILRIYARATAACPSRSEAAHGGARLCRLAGDHARAYAIAKPALGRPLPEDGLFVTPWIYAYGIDDEFAVSAYWIGNDRDCAEATARSLASLLLPASERSRIEANRRFALDRMAKPARSSPGWQPSRPLAGTELMVEGLRERLGTALDAIDLRVNLFDPATRDGRPLVVWLHHDIDQAAVQWCREAALTAAVTRFVFVSHWQQERYRSAFGLPAERCTVIRHALDAGAAPRAFAPAPVIRCAYTSTPFRGLDILLDVWDRLPAGRAELHVWSSMKLYAMTDDAYAPLLDRARTTPGVVYHGLAPNADLRAALRTMHLLTYPCTFAETACLSVIEALSAGCRVIVPAHGALPETTGGYAHVYPWSPDKAAHADLFAQALAQELANPWQGRPGDALAQQAHCAAVFSWERCLGDWRRLIGAVGRASAPARASDTPARATVQSLPFRPAVRRIETRRGPFFITDRDFIGRTLEMEGDWEPHVHDLAALVLTARSNALDLGANLGFHTVSFARLASEGEVFAFEPVDLCFSQLQMNLVLNGIANVRAYKMAVTDRSGDAVEMEAPDATSLGNGLVNIGNTRIGQGGDFTFTLRLDDLRLPRIDLVKIDIQGSEPAALRGMEALIARDRPAILVEVEEYHLRRSGSSSKALIEFFLQRGYNLLRIKTEWPADHIAIPRERTELEHRCRSYDRVPTEWISGDTVELGFDNAFLYTTVTVR